MPAAIADHALLSDCQSAALALVPGARGHDIGHDVPHALVRLVDDDHGAEASTDSAPPFSISANASAGAVPATR